MCVSVLEITGSNSVVAPLVASVVNVVFSVHTGTGSGVNVAFEFRYFRVRERENEAAVTCARLLPFTLLSFVCGLCVLVCCE